MAEKKKKAGPFGVELIMDIQGCDPKVLKSKQQLGKFCRGLAKQVGTKTFGKAIVHRFGKEHLEGNSALQFIEASSITVHCCEMRNAAYINLFSCIDFDYKKAEDYCRKFFGGAKARATVIERN